MNLLLWLAVFWLLANAFIVAFIYGAHNMCRGCTGDCYQGRRHCDCPYGEK